MPNYPINTLYSPGMVCFKSLKDSIKMGTSLHKVDS